MRGHDLNMSEKDGQICRIGAQVYHTINWIRDNEELAAQNAKKYAQANQPLIINTVHQMNSYFDVDHYSSEVTDACKQMALTLYPSSNASQTDEEPAKTSS